MERRFRRDAERRGLDCAWINSVRLENNMTRTFRIVPAIALAVAFLSGAAEAQTIKIGVNEPLTGAFAASGTYVVNGSKTAADEINAKGGILGKKLELVIEDNKSNPTEAAAVAEKLITSDKTPVMMGAWGSSLTLAVMPKLSNRRRRWSSRLRRRARSPPPATPIFSASRRRRRWRLRHSKGSSTSLN